MGKRKKKYETGESTRFMTRNQAKNYLQLTLNEFRKLCIIKGIYPREPRNRKKAQKGHPGIMTLYHKKDIQFLSHEPNILTLRSFKIFFRKIARAKNFGELDEMKKYRERIPLLKLDNIVKERYPTFIDAIRDLDDCLTLLFMFASFPYLKNVPMRVISLSRRLTVEFMHYVIAAKALRKVFISIKGYYFQADIKGQMVTWIVPHQFVVSREQCFEVNFKVMLDFVDIYLCMLGFVNFRLYHSLNIIYPPVFPGYSAVTSEKELVDEESYCSEHIAALNIDLARVAGTMAADDEEEGIDEFPIVDDQDQLEELRKEVQKVKNQKTLFKGLKFFVGREVPREPVVFALRCLGGDVSWDRTSFVGATYDESDETITHQIVDRPSVHKQYISRYYVQPQWIFDSINVRELLPVEKYFIGVVLPPHLSPFQTEHKLDHYMPPEEVALTDQEVAKQLAERSEEESSEDDEEEEEEEEEDEDEDKDKDMLSEEESGEEKEETENNSENKANEEIDVTEREREIKKKMMSVTTGELTREDPYAAKKQGREDYKLRVSMIKNKHRKLYHSMVKGRVKRNKEAWLLQKKRIRYEVGESAKRKEKRKQEKLAKAESSTSV